MNPAPKHWRQVEDLFDAIVDLDPADRSARLDRACQGNPDLRREVESLLAAYDRADDLLQDLDQLTPSGSAGVVPDRTGTHVAHYDILEKLGGGGMGVVYKAYDTKLDRPVALKFLSSHLSAHDEAKQRLIAEARAASALDHVNIAVVHEISETAEGQLFIAMAYYAGRTLKQKIAEQPLPLDEALDYAVQMAQGLSKAHTHGIVHRDIKPANVIVTDEGVAKIVDFGIAKVAGSELTKTGTTMGTVAYMSPEQARGEPIDQRTDIWSFGVVLYEMLTGQRPFKGDYALAIIYSVLNEAPEPVTTLREDIPEELEHIILRALEKDQARRFSSFQEVLEALEGHRAKDVATAPGGELKTLVRLFKKPRVAVAALAVVLVLASAVFLPYWQRVQLDRARALLPEIERLAQGGNYFEAYTLAVRAEKRLKDDSTLARWWPHIADNLTITTEPEGVRVFLQRFAPDAQGTVPAPEYVGVTPLDGLRVARADYHVRLEKEGYAPVERIASREFTPAVRLEAALLEADQVPDDMVFVPGGAYRLVGWGLPTMDEVPLDDYFIDQYEVSNSEYKAFIEAGGYRNRDYWNHPFVKDGQRLSWEEALELFTDRTGLPGPRTWVSQEFPEAEGDHPVTNITWYEAAAYAAFVGKRLPTVFQWEKTARNGAIHPYGIIMPWGLQLPQETTDYRANFDGNRPVAVDSFSFGVSPFGAYNMAGNVKEWCLNEIAGGHATTGGSWEDPQYLFARYGSFSSFHTSRALGFRCVRTAAGATGDQGALRIDLDERTPSYTPVDEATFNSFLSHYQYDKRPLNARIVETQETADWTRETVAFAGVDDDEILAYLYLPRQAAPPYQCINFVDADPMFWGFRSPTVDVEQHFAAHIRAGRALLAVVPKGGLERPREPGYRQPQKNTVKFRELVAHWAAEFSLGLDYLATRDDIDMDRVAYLGTSAGNFRIIFAAVEPRYRSVVLMGGGLRPAHQQRLPEANPINFAPRIQGPTLVINGRHDEVEPVETHVRPLYALLAGPKRLELVDGGHVPPAEQRVPVINAWLDETLGPVRYEGASRVVQ